MRLDEPEQVDTSLCKRVVSQRAGRRQDQARIATQSLVGVLDTLLASWREPTDKIGSRSAPEIGH
jgi:hypothetical protein